MRGVLAANLSYLRKSKQWRLSQKTLAKILHVPRKAIMNYECSRTPQHPSVIRFSRQYSDTALTIFAMVVTVFLSVQPVIPGAIRYGYLVELQEPTVIANPGVLVGFFPVPAGPLNKKFRMGDTVFVVILACSQIRLISAGMMYS